MSQMLDLRFTAHGERVSVRDGNDQARKGSR
jgi:hypothetical protein